MTPDTIESIMSLHAEGEAVFLQLARRLREIVDEEPRAIKRLCAETPLKQRRIYCLLRIARVFDPLVSDDERLQRIGWTKLDLVAPYTQADNVEQMLGLAEELAPTALARRLAGEAPLVGSHTVQLTFSSADYADFCRALIAARAKPSGKGHVGKEAALMRILTDWLAQQEG